MEGLRVVLGGLRATLSLLGYPDVFSFVFVFPADAGTVVLKSGVMYDEHLCVVALTGWREGSIPIRLPLTSSCDPLLLLFVYFWIMVNTGSLLFWIILKTSTLLVVLSDLLFQFLTKKKHVYTTTASSPISYSSFCHKCYIRYSVKYKHGPNK